MKRWLFCLPLLFLATLPALASDWVLIANPRVGITQLSQDQVVNIYLGRFRRLASGVAAEPIDLSVNSPLRERFYRQLVGKNQAEINAYWSRLLFSGKTQPPRVIESSEEAIKWVLRNTGALAYVDRTKVDSRVLVVFEIID